MREFNGRLSIARREDDGPLLTFWEVFDQTARSLLGLAEDVIKVKGGATIN